MDFVYVWGILRIAGTPPDYDKLGRLQEGVYTYYPFPHHGVTFTVDTSLWDLQTSSSHTVQIAYWPSADELVKLMNNKDDQGVWWLLIFSNNPTASTIDPNNSVSLSKIPSQMDDRFRTDFQFIGFDVIDMSGISALTNIGYTADNIAKLAATTVVINSYGLISSSNDSLIFAEFASEAAPEHAPFFPVEVWGERRAVDTVL